MLYNFLAFEAMVNDDNIRSVIHGTLANLCASLRLTPQNSSEIHEVHDVVKFYTTLAKPKLSQFMSHTSYPSSCRVFSCNLDCVVGEAF